MKYWILRDLALPAAEDVQGIFDLINRAATPDPTDGTLEAFAGVVRHPNSLFVHPDYFKSLAADPAFVEIYEKHVAHKYIFYMESSVMDGNEAKDRYTLIYQVVRNEFGYMCAYLPHKKEIFNTMLRKALIDEFLDENV